MWIFLSVVVVLVLFVALNVFVALNGLYQERKRPAPREFWSP